jgi:hypothetical protein
MPGIARIPITNWLNEGDYTGLIYVGPERKPMNVLLDTGSSALALDGTKYKPAGTDKPTRLGQVDAYGDGSHWAGAVIQTTVTAGEGASALVLSGANVAVAYDESKDMFQGCDGILGLAYAALDDAFEMPQNTWPERYTADQLQGGTSTTIKPYLTQLADAGTVSDKFAFVTKRSFPSLGGSGASDPINQGVMVLGGGEEEKDLYTGTFQVAKVLTDEWYNTNLKAVRVGDKTIRVSARGPKGMPSNSIVDSGTNSLNLGPRLLHSISSKLSPDQANLLNKLIQSGDFVKNSAVDLTQWPPLTFILQGENADVALVVKPSDYWQLDAFKKGYAALAITPGQDGFAILGLPLMNGYYTIFDGEADQGRGVIKFATRA